MKLEYFKGLTLRNKLFTIRFPSVNRNAKYVEPLSYCVT